MRVDARRDSRVTDSVNAKIDRVRWRSPKRR